MMQLDCWTEQVIGKSTVGTSGGESLRQALNQYTRDRLIETIEYAKEKSRYYCETISGQTRLNRENGFFEWFQTLPFTSEKDLREREKDFLCVQSSDISRIVTLSTSGTTGKPKRVYFTEEDQQLTIDFFENGMRLIVDSEDTVLILMPSGVPGSVGLLLQEGLKKIGTCSIAYGVPSLPCDWNRILQTIKEEKVTSVVAMPSHMIEIARIADKKVNLKSVLLSAEYVSDDVVRLLEEQFNCKVFEHYGMTEMGLGCAVGCGYGRGYHIREADLYIELINPITGEVIDKENPKTPGFSSFGEITFTTLTRKGMPFIRFRTGDYSRWILGKCPCGSVLKKIDKVTAR